jgi:hypothetical protein
MGFYDKLRRVLGGGDPREAAEESTSLFVTEGAGFGGDAAVDSGPAVTPDPPTDYDRAQWHKKLKRILDELPESKSEWDDLMLEAKSLELDPAWVTRCQVEEFFLLMRRAVADRRVTAEEHRKLDLARDLIGLPDAEAEAALDAVVAEAESFFGKPVKEG